MEKRRLGNSDLYVNPAGPGCMGFSHASGDPAPEEISVNTLRQAYEIGCDFFDTAEACTGVYPDGTISYNEELVGKALKDVRDKAVIATRMGVGHNEDRSLKQSADHLKNPWKDPAQTMSICMISTESIRMWNRKPLHKPWAN